MKIFATKSGMFIDTFAEIIYDKSDINAIVNVVANNIDNQNVCEMLMMTLKTLKILEKTAVQNFTGCIALVA